MPQKLGNGGYSQEQYDAKTGKYTDKGNVSREESEKAMSMLGIDWKEEKPVYNTQQSQKIKNDFYDAGYETEDNSPNIDEIYEDFVEYIGSEPQNLEDLITFVRDRVSSSLKGIKPEDFNKYSPYLVKRKSMEKPVFPPKKEEAVMKEEKPLQPQSGTTFVKNGPAFRYDWHKGKSVDPGFIRSIPNPEESKKWERDYGDLDKNVVALYGLGGRR